MPQYLVDAQAALSFMTQQATNIEAQVYNVQYPEIIYSKLIPTVTEGNEWAKSVTFFSMDKVGQADWFHHLASDMRIADVMRTKYEVGLEMAGIGYRYSLEELGQAMMVPGTNLTTERADAAKRAAEEFLQGVAFVGDTTKGWTGLLNDATVTRADAIADGTGSLATWASKTATQVMRDINNTLSTVYTNSLTVEVADTILLPPARFTTLSTMQLPNSDMNVIEWLKRYNAYTSLTSQPLTIMSVRGLETAGTAGAARMMAYRRDPQVLKFHLPMPHNFRPVWQTGPLVFDVPGIFRTGGTEIRRPKACYYLDGI
jgi:hypothetical protein